MSSTHETLFSLELVIDYVRFDCTRKNVGLAVGLRFLDFPTLLIYRSDKEDPSSRTLHADLHLSAEAASQSDERDNLTYYFRKGKSCLFKMNLDSLHSHLMNAPLYAMVLDTSDEVPKLIGSSLISLAKVTERIKVDVDKHGIATPTAYGEKIVTPLCNLMGNSIGSVSLAYKIVSLGTNLIPHIPYNRVCKAGSAHGTEEQHHTALAESTAVLNIDKDQTENHANVLSPVSSDRQPADMMRSEAKQPGITASTQTKHAKHKATWSDVSYNNDARENSTFCPPPLFYRSCVRTQQEKYRMLNVEMESLNIEDPEDENNEGDLADMHDVPKITATQQQSILASSSTEQQRTTDPAQLGDIIRQLPLLNALLNELSQLTSQTQHQQPVSVHPNLAWLYTSAPEPPPVLASRAKPKSQCNKTVTAASHSPKRRPGQSKIKECIIPAVSPSGKKANAATKDQEKLKPKKKLIYGLTNTFRLRLRHVKTVATQRHECIEDQDIKLVKPQRQTLLEGKEASGKSASRNETLISSFEMDATPIKTTSSKSQTRPSANRDRTKTVASMKDEDEDEALVTKHGRKVRVHIPSVLSHYSEHSDECSDSSGQNIHHRSPQANPDLQIFSADSRPSSSPRGRSLTSSLEQEYQDDFTSLDATDGFSPEPLSSPEPHRRKRTSVSSEHSHSNGGSDRSKVLPVPVKAENSPHRSLKSTHVIRPRAQTSALSLSSDDSEDGSSPASSGSYKRQRRPGSQSSGRRTSSVRRTFGRSESFDREPAEGVVTVNQVSVDSDVLTDNSGPQSLSPLHHEESAEERDELVSLRLDKNYHHVSELVISKLPGYTL